jgi:hypothetical protein
MSQESLERARLSMELREAREELARVSDERLRLSRRNELLSEVLQELRATLPLPEPAQRAIERALAFDGQPWSLAGGEFAEQAWDDEEEAQDDDDEEQGEECAP